MREVTETHNDTIAQADEWIMRIMIEVRKSLSANVTSVNQYDLTRLYDYIDKSEAYMEFVQSQPLPDLPETHPLTRPLRESVDISGIENPIAKEILIQLERCRLELRNSQSGRLPATLLPPDYKRFKDYMTRLRNFLKNFVEQHNTVDLPESSPQYEMTGQGNVGIAPEDEE